MPTRETYVRTGGGTGSARYPQGAAGVPAVPSLAETPAQRQDRLNRERFLRAAQAQSTLRNITGLYDAAVGNERTALEKEKQRLGLTQLETEIARNRADQLARQATNLDIFGQAIAERLARESLGAFPEQYNLNNQLFGVELREGRTKLDRADELDKFAQSTRTIDLQDIMNQRAGVTEEKRVADFNVSGKAGAESGIASGAARMGFKANTEAANIAGQRIDVLDAQSSQRLQEALANNEYDRKMVNWDLQKKGITRRERELALRERERALNAEAQRAGLERRKFEIALQTKLNESNLARVVSAGEYAEAMHKNQIARLDLTNKVVSAVGANPQAQSALRTIARGGRRRRRP